MRVSFKIPIRGLSIALGLALVLLVLLAVGVHAAVQHQVSVVRRDARQMHIVSHQRMLLQRVLLLEQLLNAVEDAGRRVSLRRELEAAARSLDRNHSELLDLLRGERDANELKAFYFEEPERFDARLQAFLGRVNERLAAGEAVPSLDREEVRRLLESQFFLVESYQRRSEAHMSTLSGVGRLLLIVEIAVILLTALIIKPVLGAVRDQLAELTRANAELEQRRNALAVAQSRLLRTTEEAEKARDSAARFQAIVEATEDAVSAKSLSGEVFSWNPGAERLYGYTAQEMIGDSISKIIPEDRRGEFLEMMDAIRRGEAVNRRITERITKDGRRLFVSITLSPLKDERGRVFGAAAIARDITRQRLSEQALRASEARFTSFMDHAPMIAFMKDEQGRYVYANKPMQEIFNIPFERLEGTTDRDWLPEVQAAEAGAHDKRVLETSRPAEHTQEVPLPDGTLRSWHVVRFPFQGPSGERFVGGVAIDVTRQKEAEAVMKKYAAELKRSNEDLEQFAYAASHDLQEPLRMVSSYTDLLSQRYADQLDSRAKEFMDYASNGAKRMQQLIRDLLQYSRVGTHGRPLVAVESSAALQDALQLLQAAVRESGAAVTHGRLPRVKADAMQLTQVFQNLVGNAIKYRRDDPPRVHVEAERDGDMWVFRVSDNGIGIEPAHAQRIFVMFQKLHSRDDYPGTGIGLALCKKIIERHGGRIWVESRAGKGSTFYFTLRA